MAGRALNVSSLGIQVVGQNLANADSPHYVREQVVINTNGTLRSGPHALGSGSHVGGVVQMLDTFLEQRLNSAQSDGVNWATQSRFYMQLETLLGELSDVDISTTLSDFFNSIGDVLNHPEGVAYRQMTVSEGQRLANELNTVSTRLLEMRLSINRNVETVADQINRLTEEIASLNRSICEIEAARSPATQAVGLRDQRLRAVSELSQLINIKVTECDNTGMINVSSGSDLLVMGNIARPVYVDYVQDPYDQMSLAVIRITGTNNILGATSGELAGLYVARDEIIGGYMRELDQFAFLLIDEFNRMFAGGQGMTGFSELTSLAAVSSTTAPLNQAGLPFHVQNGSLKILVENTETGIAETHEILIPLLNSGNPESLMTLERFAAELNSIPGINATINSFNQLEIEAESSLTRFAFADDTSGLLAALGMNTFFTGTDARTIGINDVLVRDPGKFAASRNGIGYDTGNAVSLAAMPETKSRNLGGMTITEYYRNMNNRVSNESARTQAIAKGNIAYFTSLAAQRAAISGVNLDEESINMMIFQRSYQATARYITTLNSMLDSLLTM